MTPHRPDPLYAVNNTLDGTNYRASCKGCKYRRGLGREGARFKVCNYLYDTGKPRGCPADQCDKKEVKRGAESKQRKRHKDVPAGLPEPGAALSQNVSDLSQKSHPGYAEKPEDPGRS